MFYIIPLKYELDSTMISISRQVDYGLQLLLALCAIEENTYLSLREFARDRKISFLFLQKIVRKLRVAGLVDAQKGAHGGYCLSVDPASITLKEIVEAIEGMYGPVTCIKEGVCPVDIACPSKSVFSFVQQDIVAAMSAYSLEKMIQLSNVSYVSTKTAK
ncbi:MAG: hypothetical protein COU35_00910 [Candidatus Magasanikbacteria bacterium CG10_big_fil_rev_8_21_14_0_10_47_10]|uniref:Rrf2 family transcriptional regulator n=1 Tax=Candidatus Magasanikbacteria bacterium CG10_big_fil_rev_8_21_14_0_10_47_10 TaxID=1974652 RepID=A0A2H0TT45_9BACT|nr:MAG: hypothetical protein COU35_00910 [Candidatus Magasanikbacteria bacterium CG10_big_fil_rev_8_21_14_0_10_47_10]